MIKSIILFIFFVPQLVFAECNLMPKDIDFTSKKFIKAHDKLVEEELTKYYVNDYESFIKYYELANNAESEILATKSKIERLESQINSSNKSSKKVKKDKDILQKELDDLKATEQIFKENKKSLKDLMKGLYDPILTQLEIEELEFLPDGRAAGHLTIEGFFRPLPDSKFVLPMGGLAFVMDEDSVVYVCVNFDKYNLDANYVSIRFLKTNRRIPKEFVEYIKNPYSYFNEIKGYFKKPKASIDPANLTTNVAFNTVKPISSLFAEIAPLKFVSYLLDKVGKTVDTALQEVLLDNFGIGIKSLSITNSEIRMQSGIKTLFGLVKINNIKEHTIKDDYSLPLNFFTLNPYDQLFTDDIGAHPTN